MPYIGNQPGTGVRSRFIYTATASQTTFSGADDNSKTLKYADSDYIDVYLNGVCLVPGTDYTASTKTSVVLTQAASLNDTLEVVAYDIASMADTVSKADGGTFEGDLGITNASPDLTLTNNTTEDTDGGRESTVTFKGLQSGGEESTLAEIQGSHDGTADDEKGDLIFKTNDGSDGVSPTEAMRIDSAQNVGIGNNAPTEFLTIGDTSDSASRIQFLSSTSGASTIHFGDGSSAAAYVGYINYAHDSNSLQFAANGAERMRIDSNGSVLFGTTSGAFNNDAKIVLVPNSDSILINDGQCLSLNRTVSTGAILGFYQQASGVGSISVTGSATAYNTSSDYRLKENVADISDGITRVKQLAPKRFNFIADADTTVDGFLAHEAQAVVPEAVTGEKDAMRDEQYTVTDAKGDVYTPATDDADEVIHSRNVEQPETLEEGQQWRETAEAVMGTRSVPDMQGIDQAKIVPLLTAALQEAIAKIETLETKVAALEAG